MVMLFIKDVNMHYLKHSGGVYCNLLRDIINCNLIRPKCGASVRYVEFPTVPAIQTTNLHCVAPLITNVQLSVVQRED